MNFGHAREHGIAALFIEIDGFGDDGQFVRWNYIVDVEIGRLDDFSRPRSSEIELDHGKITQTR